MSITAEVDSSDILRLVQHHLTECGLHKACRALREESGIGASVTYTDLSRLAMDGMWGEVIESLLRLDPLKVPQLLSSHDNDTSDERNTTPGLLAQVHEMAILELADIGEIDLAWATLRICSGLFETNEQDDEEEEEDEPRNRNSNRYNQRSHIEKRLVSIAKHRKGSSGEASGDATVPPNYYGGEDETTTRQKRRDDIAKRLIECIPSDPPRGRLLSLIQQAIKWQRHTGVLPMRILPQQQKHQDEETEGDGDAAINDESRRKKRKRSATKAMIDVVLGDVALAQYDKSSSQHDNKNNNASANNKSSSARKHKTNELASSSSSERIISKEGGSIKFGKSSFPESALFLPDGRGLVTGSSDGFIEIWDTSTTPSCSKWNKLRTHDLPYQANDELLLHANSSPILSLAHSLDGTLLASGSVDGMVKVWKVDSGKCLRSFERAHSQGVSCLCFSRDGSHLLAAGGGGGGGSVDDFLVREFGLRASRMLKEFRGHTSYVNTCAYLHDYDDRNIGIEGNQDNNRTDSSNRSSKRLEVITGSADGTIRLWDGKTSELIRIIRPPETMIANVESMTPSLEGSSEDNIANGRNIHSVISMHTPRNTIMVVPRGNKGFLMSTVTGSVLRVYESTARVTEKSSLNDNEGGKQQQQQTLSVCDFVTATVSPSNRWLYAVNDEGQCLCFDVVKCSLERTIEMVSPENSGGDGNKLPLPELSCLVHHPHANVVAGFSSSKNQKRGLIKLWK